MGKIKEKIKNWLLKDETQILNSLNEKFINITQNIDKATQEYRNATIKLNDSQRNYDVAMRLLENCRETMNSICEVGTDIGYQERDHNWAVICIDGKPEYVKFMHLRNDDARRVLDFLKTFEYSRRITDSPIGFNHIIDDYILKEHPWS